MSRERRHRHLAERPPAMLDATTFSTTCYVFGGKMSLYTNIHVVSRSLPSQQLIFPNPEFLRITSDSLTFVLPPPSRTRGGPNRRIVHPRSQDGEERYIPPAQILCDHLLTTANSEVKNRRGAPHVDGHDRLLHDLSPPAYPPPAQHAQVRSSR